ncbi:MAG: LUD domain-containing protein [Verrucomicrobia bacterium]|nr:LUD domain-containing protein [Verrucomicrobiota bacterium]
MSDKEKIMASVRNALTPLPRRSEYPQWDPTLAYCAEPKETQTNTLDRFKRQFAISHGKWVESWEELTHLLRELNAVHGYLDPALVAQAGDALQDFTVETSFDRQRIDDYTFGITRAAAAIAETGTIILTDRTTSARLAALAPWIHVAVVQRATVVASVAEAIANFDDDPSIVWATGPSKTADIEGILIEGVHGPGIQVCLLL